MKHILRKIWQKYRIYMKRKSILNYSHSVYVADKKNVADYRKKGFSLSESAIYDLKNNDYRDYINSWEEYQPRLKGNIYTSISDDKYLFSLVYGKYIETCQTYGLINNGKVVSVSEKVDNVNLYDFLVTLGGGCIKDRQGCDGFEVYVFKSENNQLVYKNNTVGKEQFDKIVKGFNNGIIQNLMKQGSFENSIFDKSINTVRVITMRPKGSYRHEVVAALQRIGNNRSAPVDNFNQGGYSAIIDIDTGTIGRATSLFSQTADGKREFFDNHPDTGSKIAGLKIPNWEELKEILGNTTEKLPFFEYIAWDIVVKDDGFAVIETNMKSSMNVFQIHGGLRNSYLGEKYREHGYLVDDKIVF